MTTIEKIKSIFCEAMEKPTENERVAYLDEACRDEPSLCAEIDALLRVHGQGGGFLQGPILSPPTPWEDSPLSEAPGTIIGRYKLLEKIGEGGMAVVYLAEQQEPLRRKVALKIIKLGMDTRQVIARFEAERQALALMDHPSIAKVFDAGSTETGRPYFVMELVQGVSLTEYCDTNSLSTKDRLNLFLQVCQAVQHAHTKGIIHRDLKPSNVMVTHHDGRPIPKVIDFGIAKATNQRLTEKTLFTRYAHLIGTPAYMSPEQALVGANDDSPLPDIDTRSDIYSLGVLLYELLTGTTPFRENELRKAGYLEMQRVIREQEPVKPSTRIRTATRERRSVGAGPRACPRPRSGPSGQVGGHRGPPLQKANQEIGVPGGPAYQQVRGDLDWIVMKSLEKDRSRRYETANGLAEDVRRHLGHEPILARGPSTTYRLRKFLRRHRSQALGSLLFGVLIAVVAVVLSVWNRDRRQLVETAAFRHRGILSQAREQHARADREAALETIKPILTSRHVGPEAQLLQAGILVDNRRFHEAVTILRRLLGEPPAIGGAAHALLARILWESESLDAQTLKQIEEHRRQARTLRPETADAYFLQAMSAVTVKEQLAALDRALQLEPKHYESRRLRAFTYYASRKYDRLRDDALAMTILREGDPLGYSLRTIAWRELGRHKDAIVDYDRALALTTRDSPQYLDLSVQRCAVFLRMGDYARVLAETQACLQRWPNRPVFRYHRFCAQTALGDYDAARTVVRQIVRSGAEARGSFESWCAKYVFDTLEAGRSWHPSGREPVGAAFLPLVEAEETYRALSAKARRVTTDGFTAHWSPDGKKLAFSLGVHGYNGVALFDPATKETDLLIAPGKDPVWSPDGRYIAFVRDRQVLRLPELVTPERRNQLLLSAADEEVWLMKADGTDPRRLARGHWPSWSPDAACVYYHSPVDTGLYSISLTAADAEPEPISACSNSFPALSPDGRRVAYVEDGLLKARDVASQVSAAEWKGPFASWGGVAWSPNGKELCLGGHSSAEKRAGLWICRFDRREPVKILEGEVETGSWSLGGTKLVFTLGPPFFEVWMAELDPNVSIVAALGPAQTIDEHLQELVALWTRRIEADPADPYNYAYRAGHYGSLREEAKARADTRRCWGALHPGWPPGIRLRKPWALMHAVNGPGDCQLVVFLEKQEEGIVLLRIAYGQKGRCEMKSFEIPMVVTSLVGLCFLAGLEAPPARADFTFGRPVNLGVTVNSEYRDDWPVLSPDGLELYFMSDRANGYGRWDIWRSKRAGLEDPWEPPENLGPGINSAGDNVPGSLSSDGLTLYLFASNNELADLYMARRPGKNAPWGSRINLGPVFNLPDSGDWATLWGNEAAPVISSDGLELFFMSWRRDAIGRADIYVSTRATPSAPWGAPENLGPTINTAGDDAPTAISPDGLVLFICSENRPGGLGDFDMWMARRPYKGATWSAPVNLGPTLNTPQGDDLCSLSPDGRWAYVGEFSWNGTTVRPGGCGKADLWMVPIIPIVDFNGDGKVDGKEVLALAQHWGRSERLLDIGLSPMGDGVVDVDDLTVLAGYIGQDVNDPTLIAHWALDETEGVTAADSAGENDAMVLGAAAWEPAGGKIGGALALDGKDDLVRSGKLVLDPAQGPCSVIAWVKGGAPSQVIVSHTAGANWLYLNQYGMLATDLKSSLTAGKSLASQAYIPDDQWHRVVLTWDGMHRALQMDGVEVARDTQSGLATSGGNLLIGAGRDLGTYWSGLIDDVRIYNRAVRP